MASDFPVGLHAHGSPRGTVSGWSFSRKASGLWDEENIMTFSPISDGRATAKFLSAAAAGIASAFGHQVAELYLLWKK